VIDQVWHEHLLFSRAYREFCASVLRREFDHNPELVPLDEQTAEFHAQFAETRALYRAEFDREPPAEFWGVAKFAGRPEPAGEGKPRRKREDRSAAAYEDTPLYAYFSGSSDSGSHAHPSLPEFGGGESGGGGGGEAWSDSTSSGGHGDAGGASDGGSSDGGGSGCSSGCGGD
jgi:uncharacterized membrane protein YgcG